MFMSYCIMYESSEFKRPNENIWFTGNRYSINKVLAFLRACVCALSIHYFSHIDREMCTYDLSLKFAIDIYDVYSLLPTHNPTDQNSVAINFTTSPICWLALDIL